MEHAHPLPEASAVLPQPSQSSYTLPPTTGPTTTLASSPSTQSPNQQTRLLQLRNAGFRGSFIPARRISPIFSSPPQLPEHFARPIYDENSPRTLENRKLYGEDLPPNPVNILQEIHNSTRRRRSSPRPGFGTLFQDKKPTRHISPESGSSWDNRKDRNRSPSPSSAIPFKMLKVREDRANERTPPPLSSPLSRQAKSRKMNRLSLRSTSSEGARYIEHLESQLTTMSAKLESLASPTANKVRSTKLRELTVESHNLRKEISGWEKDFAERVREGIMQRTEFETGMRSRLQLLEDELDVKDVRIRELEWEYDAMRAKVKEAEGLKEVNLNLEKRIDVLTSLLVVSPTKLELGSTVTSPIKTDPFKRGPRPRSMLPRIPSSPGGVRLSLNTATEANFWHSRHFGSTSRTSDSPGGTSQLFDENEREASEYMAEATRLRSSSRASASYRSVPSYSTQPTSIQSDSSHGLISPGCLPVLTDYESQTKSAIRQRKMRRFPSGSCTLKPLILPKTGFTLSLPASAPLHAASGLPESYVSVNSFDPTNAFLSRNDYSSPISTPTLSQRQRSATWAQNRTLQALEGKMEQIDGLHHTFARAPSTPPSETLFESFDDEPCDESREKKKPRRARPLSLDKELELAHMINPNQFEDGLIPTSEAQAKIDDKSASVDFSPAHETTLPNACLRQRKLPSESEITPRPSRSYSEVKRSISLGSPPKPFLSATNATRSALGIFARLTSLISRVKQDPVVLAQRLLYNAWTLGSSRLGGIGWWLLGLVFGPYKQTRVFAADGKTVEENPSSHFNWHQFSATASRARTAEYYMHNQAAEPCSDDIFLHHLQPLNAGPNSGNASNMAIANSPLPQQEPYFFPCDACVEPSSRRTFRLWFHFSLAIVLAVGVAIKHGPGVLLIDTISGPNHLHPRQPDSQHHQSPYQSQKTNPQQTSGLGEDVGIDGDIGHKNVVPHGKLIFAEVLGPSDFENAG